eukprot:1154939-Pelagomonas_calceolata.AAC.10
MEAGTAACVKNKMCIVQDNESRAWTHFFSVCVPVPWCFLFPVHAIMPYLCADISSCCALCLSLCASPPLAMPPLPLRGVAAAFKGASSLEGSWGWPCSGAPSPSSWELTSCPKSTLQEWDTPGGRMGVQGVSWGAGDSRRGECGMCMTHTNAGAKLWGHVHDPCQCGCKGIGAQSRAARLLLHWVPKPFAPQHAATCVLWS